jgi:hypothetical protein
MEPRTFVHARGGVTLDAIDRLEVGREWKIADLVVLE